MNNYYLFSLRRPPLKAALPWILLTCLSLTILTSTNVRAEFALGAYGGKAWTLDSEVRLDQPGGTNLTFNDVSWNDESFKSPIYYGARLTYWLESKANWGFEAEFIHAKMVAELKDTVAVKGTRNGMTVSGSERLSNTFDHLEFSHGLNLLMFNARYRWFPTGRREDNLLGRIQPYLGLGAGMAIPHVEVSTNAVNTGEYQIAGPAFQGLAGINLDITDYLSLFTEYKLSYADIEADLSDGGTLRVEPITNHLVLGASLNF